MDIFSAYRIGSIDLKNRLVMAPMTRGRAEVDGTPNALMRDYYSQRATAGLIITEATPVSEMGVGWYRAARMYNDSHESGWKNVVEGVHAAGGKIMLQLWHMGRVSHPDFHDGQLPVGPSAIAAQGDAYTPSGKKPYVTPRALSKDEIKATVVDYAKSAERAIRAGFDGVEIHGANGYLIDQFLRDCSNQRTDEYGGSIENRTRFMFEVVDAVCSAIGGNKVGIRVSPLNPYNSMSDSNPVALFSHVAHGLNETKIAFIHVMEPGEGHLFYTPGGPVHPSIRKLFKRTLILNGGLDKNKGNKVIESGAADLIAIGVPFLANPDLVRRYGDDSELNQPDFDTFCTHDPKGYNDYPAL